MPRPTLAARGESPAAFDRRCIPPWATLGVVHAGSNTPGILPPRALRGGRLDGLGATRGFYHGLLATPPRPLTPTLSPPGRGRPIRALTEPLRVVHTRTRYCAISDAEALVTAAAWH